jgi:membrane fusion protein, multidrug efflux system
MTTASNNATTAPADAPGGAPAAPPAVSGSPKRTRILLIIATVFILAAAAYAVYWFLVARYEEDTEDAYVQGNVVQVTPQVSGTVTKIYADDTDMVSAGQPLVTLDRADTDIALADAEAQLAQTVREVRTLYTAQAQSRANLALREAELARARDDLARRKALTGSGAVSGEEIRHAELSVTTAQAAVGVAREQLASGQALTNGTSVAQHPNVQRAMAHVQEVMLAQSRTILYAPVGGQIAKRNVQVGQRINPGAALMAIVPPDQLWVDANFKENQLTEMRVGQPVRLTTDLYGSKISYSGKVIGMAAGTGSAFALLPAQNATGNWIKVAQRVPVRIALDAGQLRDHPLRIGLSMQASVDLHERNGARVGTETAAIKATQYTAATMPTDARIKSKIDAIISANLK